MKKVLIEIWGWYGAFALLGAFALVSFEVLSPQGFWYQFLNVTGASGIVAVSLFNKAYPPAALNTVWFLIALIALGQLFF